MSYSLSAPPRPIPHARQRSVLLLASVALHAAVLIPIALNTVFIPTFNEDRDFDILLDLRPEAQPLVPIPERAKPDPLVPIEEQPLETPVEAQPTPQVPQVQRPQERLDAATPQQTLRDIDQRLPQMAPQRSLDAEVLNDPVPLSTVDPLSNRLPTVTRPIIEEIDGPNVASQSDLDARRMPSMVSGQNSRAQEDEDTEGQAGASSSSGAMDAPIPRRARSDADTAAAMAAAGASGALDDAWTYRPEAGGASGGASGGNPSSGAGGVSGNTATQTGRIHYGRSTPLDCTQPQMLSDVQRLSCDSAADRRMRDSMARNQRIQGTGDNRRDAQLGAQGQARLDGYEERRLPLRGGTGVEPIDPSGSGRGEILDHMSGTNREVEKLQDQMAPMRGPR